MVAPLGNGAGATPATGANREREQLRQAAQAFEAVFLRQLIGSVRQAKLAEDPFSSRATEQFREMSDASLADSMSAQGTFGIADLLLAQFDRAGAARTAPTAESEPNPETGADR